MSRQRAPERADWPSGLTARKLQTTVRYYYKKDGKQIPLGGDLQAAITTADKLNIVDQAYKAVRKKIKRGGHQLLHPAEIFARATPWEGTSGIYFLIRGVEVVYVGQSTNIQRRLEQHAKEGRVVFDSYYWHPCPEAEMGPLEKAYIAFFRPVYNDFNSSLAFDSFGKLVPA